jgi:hypothetical protein
MHGYRVLGLDGAAGGDEVFAVASAERIPEGNRLVTLGSWLRARRRRPAPSAVNVAE